MSERNLMGRKALVTGGARGIGAGIAKMLAAEGAAVMIADVSDDPGRQVVAELEHAGARSAFTLLDVTDDQQWESAVAATVREFGGFDLLVNNAGVEITSLVIDLDAAHLRRMCDVNVIGTGLGMKHAFRAMRPGGAAGRGGSVVNIASVAATVAFPAISGYSATKSAVDRMTRIGAMEAGKLGYGVRVNCVYPGLIPTDMGIRLANDMVAVGLAADIAAAMDLIVQQTPLGRLAEVVEVAEAVAFLSSDRARFITGAGVPVDGGMGM